MKIKDVQIKIRSRDTSISQRIGDTVETWLCDSYSIDTRFIAKHCSDGSYKILSSALILSPLPHKVDHNFHMHAGELFVGQQMISKVARKKLTLIMQNVLEGGIHVYGKKLELEKQQTLDFYSESLRRDQWFFPLHLRIACDRPSSLVYVDSFDADNALRSANLPFDGVADLASWLDISDPTTGQEKPSIIFRMNPPADLALVDCKLSDGFLTLNLHAHPKLDRTKIGVSIRSVPGKGLTARRQIGEGFKWARLKDGIRVGTCIVSMEATDQVLVILSVDGSIVRKHWFVDQSRARNQRLVAVQQFDNDLRMIRREVLSPSTADKFELGVSALLFLMGFNPVVQIETDSPDIVLMTPDGRLAIIECTTRTADGSLKLGKLVDRRGALTKALSANEHPNKVLGILVCALPKDQMAISEGELLRNKIVLLCREDIAEALERLRFPKNPDQIFVEAEKKISNAQPSPF